MVRCWCHAAMGGWLGAFAPDGLTPSQGRMLRWQYECERAGGDCASRVEAIALRLPCARAVRWGAVLRLYTRAGTIEFVDQPGEPAVEHRYLGLLEPGLQHLMWTRGAHGIRFVTVADEDGRQAAFPSLAQVQCGVARRQQPHERAAFTT